VAKNKQHTLPKKTGESVTYLSLGNTLTVRRLNRVDYSAKVKESTRLRFGNAKEIRQDIAFFLENGILPAAKGGWA
jgi:hypothetical protein